MKRTVTMLFQTFLLLLILCLILHVTCLKPQGLSYLEEESISDGVAEAEDKVFLWMFRHSLDYAVFHPQRMFSNAVVVDPRATVGLIQEESAAWRNTEGESL